MSQVRLHERSFSETSRRKIMRREGRYFERKRPVLHDELPTPRPSFPNTPRYDYDSDSERSDAGSEPVLGAKRHTFKDSGYSSLNTTPAGSPRCIVHLGSPDDEEAVTTSPSTGAGNARLKWDDRNGAWVPDLIVQNTAIDSNWHTKKLSIPAELHVVAHEKAFTRDTENTAEYYTVSDGSAAVRELQRATVSEQSSLVGSCHDRSEAAQERVVRPQAMRFSSDAGPHSTRDRRLGKFRQHFKFLRRFVDGEDRTEKVGNVGPERVCTYRSQATTLIEEPSQCNFYVMPSVPDIGKIEPLTTETPAPVPWEPISGELSSASPVLAADLPSAVAALEIEHIASQPSTSLGRTPDSSRTLNTLSEGEMSFMGMDDGGVSDTGLNEAFDGEITQCLEKLAERIVHRCLQQSPNRGLRMHAGRQSGSSSSSSSSASTRSTPNITPITSATNTPVRPSFARKSQDDPDDEGDGRRSRTSKRKNPDVESNVRLFACPFAKLDPSKYSRENLGEPNYWNCGNCCLRDISRLKQHLYRVHSRPAYYCGSCFQSFKIREDLDQHTRQRPACELSSPKYADRMTDNQFQSIKRRVIRGDPCELWFSIFQILFPSAPKPPSPYVSTADAATINHFVALFRWFGPEEMRAALSAREGQPRHPLLDLSTQAVVDEAFEIAMPDYLRRRRSSQFSAAPTDIQVRRATEVLEEDMLTMAPYEGLSSQRNAPDQLHSQLSEPFEPALEADVEDNTPRALAVPSGAAMEIPHLKDAQTTSFGGWPFVTTAQPQIQAAFDSYMPFHAAMLPATSWSMQDSPEIFGDAQKSYGGSLDCGPRWTTDEMC